MATKKPKCAELVGPSAVSEVATVRALLDAGGEWCEEVESSLYEYGLSADYVPPGTFDDIDVGFFRWQLSWGGPSDEFRFYCSPGRWGPMPHCIEYRYHDWWDGAGVDLTGDALDTLKEAFEYIFPDPEGMIEEAGT